MRANSCGNGAPRGDDAACGSLLAGSGQLVLCPVGTDGGRDELVCADLAFEGEGSIVGGYLEGQSRALDLDVFERQGHAVLYDHQLSAPYALLLLQDELRLDGVPDRKS